MVESFESYRSYLFAIAYRMLGSAMDAEDMVQETYLRYQTIPPETITSHKAFLTTILVRLCMDQLHLARRQREQYLGPWLPEPVITANTFDSTQMEERVDIYESVSLAFLVLLEQLQPLERAVFLLREVFGYEYAEIAAFLGKSEAACRQSFSRAKKHLADRRPRFHTSPETQRQMLTSFYQAVQAGDMSALMNMLAEDVAFWADGGGKVKGAATRMLSGRVPVARFVLGSTAIFASNISEEYRVEVAEVNGQLAAVIRTDERAVLVLTIEIEKQQIRTIRAIANPDKLAHI